MARRTDQSSRGTDTLGRYRRVVVMLLTLAMMLGSVWLSRVDVVAAQSIDLSQYYPNTSMISGYYLQGHDRLGSAGQVLWYEAQDSSNFRQYNSAPDSASRRCNWDQWQISAAVLSYSETNNTCPAPPPAPPASNDISFT